MTKGDVRAKCISDINFFFRLMFSDGKLVKSSPIKTFSNNEFQTNLNFLFKKM